MTLGHLEDKETHRHFKLSFAELCSLVAKPQTSLTDKNVILTAEALNDEASSQLFEEVAELRRTERASK